MNKDKTDIFKKSGNSEYETDIVKKIEKDEDIIVDKFDNINSSPLVREFTDSRGETGNLYLNEIEQSISVTGELFSYSFDVKTGFLESIKYQDKELIKQGPKFNVWRPPVANELDEWPLYRTDIGYISKGMGNDLANGWRTIGLNNLTHELKKISAVKNDDSEIIISADYLVIGSDYNSGFEANYKYIITEEGKIFINFKASPLSNMTQWLPKIGLQMKLLKEFEELKWFGRGPFENYPDRKTGAKIGIYESNVNDEYQPYLIPQDYGNKTDVRWAFLTNGENKGLAITGCDLLNISVHKYDPDNLTRARHTFQLEDVDYVTLNIDHQVSGVGGTAVSVLNKYKVLPAEYEFAVCLVPF